LSAIADIAHSLAVRPSLAYGDETLAMTPRIADGGSRPIRSDDIFDPSGWQIAVFAHAGSSGDERATSARDTKA